MQLWGEGGPQTRGRAAGIVGAAAAAQPPFGMRGAGGLRPSAIPCGCCLIGRGAGTGDQGASAPARPAEARGAEYDCTSVMPDAGIGDRETKPGLGGAEGSGRSQEGEGVGLQVRGFSGYGARVV